MVWQAVVDVLGDLGSELASEDAALAAGVVLFLLFGFSDSPPQPGLAADAPVLSPLPELSFPSVVALFLFSRTLGNMILRSRPSLTASINSLAFVVR